MQNLLLVEVEMIGLLLARAGVNQVEAAWANSILNRLRSIALEQQARAAQEQKETGETIE